MRWTTLTLGALAIAACGGDAFEQGAPAFDGAVDTANPPGDGSLDGASGGTGGSGGSGGTGGTGGAGTGGTGTGGAGTAGMAGGDAADDARSDTTAGDARDDGTRYDGNDGRPDSADSATSGDAGHATDVADASSDGSTSNDAPTSGDAPIGSDARDAGGDTSVNPDTNDATPADIVCTEPIVYYKDEDGDGYGADNMTTSSCTPLGDKWSSSGGDCRDDLPAVRPFRQGAPNPPAYSGVGYPSNNSPQGVSFDYDCSGTEEADPMNAYGAEPECAGPLSCSGVGYIAANPSRQGPGVNPRCGSTTLKRCQLLFAVNGPALCSSALEQTQIPYRCR